MLVGANLISLPNAVTEQCMTQRSYGLKMTLQQSMEMSYQKQMFGHLDSLAKTSQSQENSEDLKPEQEVDCFMKLCDSLTKQKKINPNGYCVKTLETCYQLMGGRNVQRSL